MANPMNNTDAAQLASPRFQFNRRIINSSGNEDSFL